MLLLLDRLTRWCPLFVYFSPWLSNREILNDVDDTSCGALSQYFDRKDSLLRYFFNYNIDFGSADHDSIVLIVG